MLSVWRDNTTPCHCMLHKQSACICISWNCPRSRGRSGTRSKACCAAAASAAVTTCSSGMASQAAGGTSSSRKHRRAASSGNPLPCAGAAALTTCGAFCEMRFRRCAPWPGCTRICQSNEPRVQQASSRPLSSRYDGGRMPPLQLHDFRACVGAAAAFPVFRAVQQLMRQGVQRHQQTPGSAAALPAP